MRTIKFCSVVFGVTLRLLVINTLSSYNENNKRRRLLLPAMSVTNLPRFGAAVCITFGGRTVDNRRWSQILVENRDFCLPYLHLKPPLGGYRRNIAITFGVEKVEWCGYPMVKKSLRIILFSRVFDRIPACDTRTDRHRAMAYAVLMHCIASRQQKRQNTQWKYT